MIVKICAYIYPNHLSNPVRSTIYPYLKGERIDWFMPFIIAFARRKYNDLIQDLKLACRAHFYSIVIFKKAKDFFYSVFYSITLIKVYYTISSMSHPIVSVCLSTHTHKHTRTHNTYIHTYIHTYVFMRMCE